MSHDEYDHLRDSADEADRAANREELKKIVYGHPELLDALLTGTGTEASRSATLMSLLTEAWGAGYKLGLTRGGRFMAEAIKERMRNG